MIEQIRQSIAGQIEFEHLNVTGEGGRYEINIIAEAFRDLNRVKQQQLVYACIKHLISDGSVHAVTINAQSPSLAD